MTCVQLLWTLQQNRRETLYCWNICSPGTPPTLSKRRFGQVVQNEMGLRSYTGLTSKTCSIPRNPSAWLAASLLNRLHCSGEGAVPVFLCHAPIIFWQLVYREQTNNGSKIHAMQSLDLLHVPWSFGNSYSWNDWLHQMSVRIFCSCDAIRLTVLKTLLCNHLSSSILPELVLFCDSMPPRSHGTVLCTHARVFYATQAVSQALYLINLDFFFEL